MPFVFALFGFWAVVYFISKERKISIATTIPTSGQTSIASVDPGQIPPGSVEVWQWIGPTLLLRGNESELNLFLNHSFIRDGNWLNRPPRVIPPRQGFPTSTIRIFETPGFPSGTTAKPYLDDLDNWKTSVIPQTDVDILGPDSSRILE